MKFAIVAAVLALALGANASLYPLGPVVVGGPLPGAVVVGHPGPLVVGPGPVQVVTSPVHVPAVVAVAAPGAVSVSKTRGAVHVAPLPGHAQSVVQANLQPAPGTL
ncbi:adult cuticle protein 1-like [Musca domestica]|uniref:Adult cuticle protein 1-like n=1 Tax=Musca domestica TaxID=7370 RepID=A0A1I8M6M2_MUSDO|nr:adult cuticle protein 1-like [Musca domestica]